MTLNIMLTSRHAVYLTGDFRLTYSDGTRRDDLFVQKIIPVVKYNWCALVAFCGLAKTSSGLDVGDWIAKQVCDDNLEDSLKDFVVRLKKADDWISKHNGDRRINISIAGYKKRKPFVILLSNYQDLDGNHHSSTLPRLRKYELKPKESEVRIFGDTGGVNMEDRNVLKKLLSQNDSDKLQAKIADVNINASSRVRSISPEFVAGHIHPSGNGAIVPYGINKNKKYIPNFIVRKLAAMGVNEFELKRGKNGEEMLPGWVQTAFKIQETGKDAWFSELYEFRNVVKLIGVKQKGKNVFFKIAGANEPKTVHISINNSRNN